LNKKWRIKQVKMRRMFARVGALTLGVLLSLPVSATIFSLQAVIDGAQANAGAGTGSAGTGSAAMTFDDASNLFNWNITWGGLSGSVSSAHFHGPALPNQNAGVKVPIGVLTSPSIGSATLSSSQASDLLSNLWYINIHTALHPAGEIRGKVNLIPEPMTAVILLTGLAGLGVLGFRKR
jgi:hypothetical protein